MPRCRQSGKQLTTAEREEAKMADEAIGKLAQKLYLSHGDSSLLTSDEQKLYNSLTGLAAALSSKYSGAEAAILGAANVLPVDKITSLLRDKMPGFANYQDSLYSDKNIANLLANSSLQTSASRRVPRRKHCAVKST